MLAIEMLLRHLVYDLQTGSPPSDVMLEAAQLQLRELENDRVFYAKQIDQARATCTDELEIDDEPLISASNDGVWVQSWTYAPIEKPSF